VKLRSLKIDGALGEALWGVSHLWYLEFVLVYCLAAWLSHHLLLTLARPPVAPLAALHQFRRVIAGLQIFSSRVLKFIRSFEQAPLILGTAICGALLWRQPKILIGFRHGWLPHWENLLFFTVPFWMGWVWEERPSPAQPFRWKWITQLAAATAVFAVLQPRLSQHLAQETIPVADPWLPVLFALFGLLMASGLFGLCLSLRFERTSAAISYVAQASFWIYLLHHPVAGLLHVDLDMMNLPAAIEWLLAAIVSMAVCLMSYELGVRRTWVGVLLNGRRDGSSGAAAGEPPVSIPDEKRQAA
jgi:hypothetical protein